MLREEGPGKTQQSLEGHGHKPRSAWHHQKVEGEEGTSPGASWAVGGSTADPLTLDFWPPGR